MNGSDMILVLFLVAVFAGLVCAVVWFCLKKSPDAAEKIRRDYGGASQALTERLGRKIVEVKMLGAGSTEYKRSGVGGAIVGGMVAGPLGAMVGGTASSGKGKQKQRFAVKYSDGSVEIKEVHVNSREYRELMKFVSWEDIR